MPASSANLGPGFDVLAAALALHLDLEVVETGQFAVVTDLPVPTDRDQPGRACLRAPAPAPTTSSSGSPPRSRCTGGLGSSAAAIVAGLIAADHLFELDADVLGLAIELEGHPDNVAAAFHGGIVICDGPRTHRFDAPMGLEAVLAVPEESVQTAAARAALPPTVPMPMRCSTSPTPPCSFAGSARARWS